MTKNLDSTKKKEQPKPKFQNGREEETNGRRDKNGTENLGKEAEKFWQGKFWGRRAVNSSEFQATDTLLYSHHLYNLVKQ